MLLLIYTLVRAPSVGWGTTSTIVGLVGAGLLLLAFVAKERRDSNPLVPLSIFRIKGLAAADATQVIAMAGFYSMFFFLTLYMQNVLGFSQIQAGTRTSRSLPGSRSHPESPRSSSPGSARARSSSPALSSPPAPSTGSHGSRSTART